MEHRKLNGLEVAELGLGCLPLSPVYGPVHDDESIALVHRALDAGITMLDTADLYGEGHNETLLGKALAGRRGDAVVATKFGILGHRDDGGLYVDSSPGYARQALDASLSRLGVDEIDLYYIHRRHPDVPIEDTMQTMVEFQAAGKIRHIGLSEMNAGTIRRAHAVHPITAVQMEWSLFERDVEREVLAACTELNIGIVAYSPFGRGLLSTSADRLRSLADDDYRHTDPRFQGTNLAANLTALRALTRMAEAWGHTPAQLALAWLLAKDPSVVPIPGTADVRHLEQNLAATGIRLSADEVAELDRAVPMGTVSGERYPGRGMADVDL
ncbi:MAG: aldo/keto reductase [Actinophytocola sp.]|uniref:aldo/keto reductase n=1 Tax=Actinophytocola sp. TaxID=1872138 RepID=UPI003C772DF4